MNLGRFRVRMGKHRDQRIGSDGDRILKVTSIVFLLSLVQVRWTTTRSWPRRTRRNATGRRKCSKRFRSSPPTTSSTTTTTTIITGTATTTTTPSTTISTSTAASTRTAATTSSRVWTPSRWCRRPASSPRSRPSAATISSKWSVTLLLFPNWFFFWSKKLFFFSFGPNGYAYRFHFQYPRKRNVTR